MLYRATLNYLILDVILILVFLAVMTMMEFIGPKILIFALAVVAYGIWELISLRRYIVAVSDVGELKFSGRTIALSSLVDATLVSPGFSEGIFAMIAAKIAPEKFPSKTKLVMRVAGTTQTAKLTIKPLHSQQEFLAKIAAFVRTVEVRGDAERSLSSWEEEKTDLIDALHSGDGADRAYAVERLTHYLEIGIKEAKYILEQNNGA